MAQVMLLGYKFYSYLSVKKIVNVSVLIFIGSFKQINYNVKCLNSLLGFWGG